MDERYYEMLRLKESGKTYQEIADIFGLSRQRVFQILGKTAKKFFKPFTPKQCVYDGLRNWLNENKCTTSEFTRRYYGTFHPESYNRVFCWFKGKTDISMSRINKILDITGLTYEQAFINKKEQENGK